MTGALSHPRLATMRIAAGALALAFLLAGTVAAQVGTPYEVLWRGTRHDQESLPKSKVSGQAMETVLLWADYRRTPAVKMEMSRDERVIFLHNEDTPSRLKLIEKTLDEFDRILPLLKDTEDTHNNIIVLVGLGKPVEYGRVINLLDGLATRQRSHPIIPLAGRDKMYQDPVRTSLPLLERARAFDPVGVEAGMLLEGAMVGAFVDPSPERSLKDDPEADALKTVPANELVNRLVHLLLYKRYGPLPMWVRRGVAWHVEARVARSGSITGVHCFPGLAPDAPRPTDMPAAWNTQLEETYGPRDDRLRPSEFTSVVEWDGSYDALDAAMAWGMVGFLSDRRGKPDRGARILTEMAKQSDKQARDILKAREQAATKPTGYDERNLYQLPLEAQRTILREFYDEKYLARAREFLGAAVKNLR